MTILERLNSDMKEAMKAKDSFSLSVIRMAKGAIQLEAINKKKELSDDDMVSVISKQIKMRKDSIEEFEKGNRKDLIKQNLKEIEILNKYMPEQLSNEEIIKIIDDVFNTINPTSPKDIGLIMKEISPKLKGKADMGYVNSIIKDKLTNL